MKKGFRFKIEHMGDIVADVIETIVDTARCRATGVIVGYHVHQIDKKQRHVVTKIGERVVEIKKDDPDLFDQDDRMSTLFADYDELQSLHDKNIARKNAARQQAKQKEKRYQGDSDEEFNGAEMEPSSA